MASDGIVYVIDDDESARHSLEFLLDVAGKAYKAIGFDLDISPRTVEVYRANLMMKMQAKTLSDLVRMATIVSMSR